VKLTTDSGVWTDEADEPLDEEEAWNAPPTQDRQMGSRER
jgi:hypothetical protein